MREVKAGKHVLFLLPKNNKGTCTPEELPRSTLLCMASSALKTPSHPAP